MYIKSFISYLLAIVLLICSSISYSENIGNLTTIKGIRENELIGYGLVVGLPGTGDSIKQSPFTFQTLHNLLTKLGINISEKDEYSDSKNTASVVVTAKLPPFAQTGQKINVQISSIGNAKSLSGGTLLLTPLLGLDNETYAVAQGNIDFFSSKNEEDNIFSTRPSSNKNVVVLHNGAIVEKSVESNFLEQDRIQFQLNKPDILVAQKISDSINLRYKDASRVLNPNVIQVFIDKKNRQDNFKVISTIENIFINMSNDQPKLIVDAKTGLVTLNVDVPIGTCKIIGKQFSLLIDSKKNVLQYFPTHVNKNLHRTDSKSKYYNGINNFSKTEYIENNISVFSIITVLNKFHISPNELVSILRSMKDVGALEAILEIR